MGQILISFMVGAYGRSPSFQVSIPSLFCIYKKILEMHHLYMEEGGKCLYYLTPENQNLLKEGCCFRRRPFWSEWIFFKEFDYSWPIIGNFISSSDIQPLMECEATCGPFGHPAGKSVQNSAWLCGKPLRNLRFPWLEPASKMHNLCSKKN